MLDYSKVVNPILPQIKPSGIRKYFGIASTMTGVVSLGVGEPDFVTPKHIMQAGIDSLLAGKTQYTANQGMPELREAIAAYLEDRFSVSYDPEDEILITIGGSEANDLAWRAFLMPGDEVIVPDPGYVSYEPLVRLAGATPVIVRTDKEHCFKLTPEALKAAITPKTKMLILNYPNNPTGGIMTRDELMQLVKELEGTNILVLTDEIYAELTYGEKHTSIASLPGMRERCIFVSGFSKAFAMTGWRLGYSCAPRELMKQMAKIHQYSVMSASTPAQFAGVEAMRHGVPDTEAMVAEYDVRRKFLYQSLIDLGFDCFEPQGAFYMFPDVTRFAKDGDTFVESLLREEKVCVVPGSAFGESGNNHIRISYAYSLEELKVALGRIEKFLARHR